MRALNERYPTTAVVDAAPSTAPLLITPAVVGGGDASFDAEMAVILAALLCVLVCALGLNSLVHCFVLRLRCGRGGALAATAAAAPVPVPATGTCCSLEKRQLRRIPVVLYDHHQAARAGGASTAATTDCAICLGEFDGGDMLRVLPRCRHGFHVQCVDAWLATHPSCPTCRNSLLDEDEGDDGAREATVVAREEI